MSARTGPASSTPVDLRKVRPEQMQSLFEEEVRRWHDDLDWDFHSSARLLQRFISARALHGFATLEGNHATGYSYYVCEEHKGVIGDLYVRRAWRTEEAEFRLLEATLEAIRHTDGAVRIEAQLMLLGNPMERSLPYPHEAKRFSRHFMVREASAAARPEERPGNNHYQLVAWSSEFQEEAAQLIDRAYHGHIDSLVNDQYQSVAGARRFLTNLVQYPGCGTFFPPGSFLAMDRRTQRVCGLILCSLVASDVGHVTQVCTDPDVRRAGIARELMRRCLEALAAGGCRRVGLTVTATNEPAVRLYETLSFTVQTTFGAYVWGGN